MSVKKELQTILVIAGGLILMYFIFKNQSFLIAALVIGIPGFLIPFIRKWIVKIWFQIASILGFINSRILLSLVFFLILSPIALLRRLFSKDKLQVKRDKSRKTFYTTRIHQFQSEDFKNPW